MLTKRIIPCLDVTEGRVVKGINFVNLKDIGDPVVLARAYSNQGADELVFLDITASSTGRDIMKDLVGKIAKKVFIPFTIGGGLRSVEDIREILRLGADKVSLNSAAVLNPNLIEEAREKFGSQCITVAVDVKKSRKNWDVYIYGGRKKTDWNVLDWITEVQELGAGEILLTSMDQDGTRTGFDIALYQTVEKELGIPVVASGGGGTIQAFKDLFEQTEVDAALAASIFHYDLISLQELKEALIDAGIPVRPLEEGCA